MTHSIGNIPISSIQDVNFSSSKETEELDLIDENSNFVFLGAESADDINIDFSLFEKENVSSLSLEEKREELKELSSRDVIDNSFEFNGKRGRISVENVSIPESGSEPTIVSGSIEGTFLPWPKYFPDDFPKIIFFLSGSVNGNHKIRSDLLIEKLLDGNIDSSFIAEDRRGFGDGVYGSSTYSYDSPTLSLFVSVEGSAGGNLDSTGELNL